MEWCSKNVSQGGIFHTKIANYSPENVQFIKLLNQETKFAMFDCRNRNYFLRNPKTQQIPPPSKSSKNELNSLVAKRRIPATLIRPTTSRRRSQQTIHESGVYQREKFLPVPNSRPDRPKEIRLLQERMANRGTQPTRVKQKETKVEPEEDCTNRFDQLLQEIEERRQFLDEMAKLGEAKKYQNMINKEIQLRISEMKKLKIK